MTPLSDDELLAGFEAATLPAAQFGHAEHMRVAWLMLRAAPPLEAMARFVRAIRLFATVNNVPERYHETITWAYLLIIRERRERLPPDAPWSLFAQLNSDLLERGFLGRFYREETLRSPLARQTFVWPDRSISAPQNGSAPSKTLL